MPIQLGVPVDIRGIESPAGAVVILFLLVLLGFFGSMANLPLARELCGSALAVLLAIVGHFGFTSRTRR
jgi:hypothetical protein